MHRLRRSRLIAQVLWLCVLAPMSANAQRVVDRIVARVEDEIVLQSDVEQLARYQLLVDGKAESNEQILDRLIDQWIVKKEAEASRFPAASDADVDRGIQRLKRSFAKEEDFEAQRKKVGLSEEDIRQIVTAQTYLSNYLDSRFRPSVQVDDKAIQDFYDTAVIPRAKARGQEPPTFDAARDVIQEVLTQQGINAQADKWLKESRTRLSITKNLTESGR
ncbi:MAG: hypothetical protein NVS9B14_16720 [Candidatus Acidiferrum sp.]